MTGVQSVTRDERVSAADLTAFKVEFASGREAMAVADEARSSATIGRQPGLQAWAGRPHVHDRRHERDVCGDRLPEHACEI